MNSKNDRKAKDLQLAEGLKKHTSKSTVWVIGQKKYDLATILGFLARRVNSAQVVANAKAAWQGKRQEDEVLEAETARILAALGQNLLVTFDGLPDVLADFGLSPRKAPRALTGEEMVLKAAKARATREARHTLGKRARQAIKGTTSDVGPPILPPAPTNGAPPPTNGAAATNGAAST